MREASFMDLMVYHLLPVGINFSIDKLVITFLVVLTYFSPKMYVIAGNIYGKSEEKIE